MLRLGTTFLKPLASKLQPSRAVRSINNGIRVFQEKPESVAGVALTLAAAVGAFAYSDTWLPYVEGAVRFCRSVTAATIISLDYKYGKELMAGKGMTKAEMEHVIHRRSAERLLSLFKKQGGVYVKAGQHMASLYYLLPKEYCTVLSELHNRASAQPFEAILPVIRDEMGSSPTDCFDSLDSVPVAAASIAQVHRGKYNGMDVAVKVQFPDVDRLSSGDVRTIEVITDAISWAFPEFKLKWLVREFDANLPLELDFTHEAANSNRIRKLFANDPRFCTPRVFYATKKVLVMEWIDGKHIDDVSGILDMGLDPHDVASELNRVFSEQIFVHRFVHCDPHAGNVLVRKTKDRRNPFQICLLDNGLYRDYSEEFCLDYAQLWMAILQQDEKELSRVAKRMDVSEHRLFASVLTARSWEGVQKKLFHNLQSDELTHIQSQAALKAAAITEILAQVPSPLLLVLKTNDLLRSINQALGVPSVLVFSYTLHACQTALQSYQARYKTGIVWACRRIFERWNLQFKLFIMNLMSFVGALPTSM